MDDQRDEQQQDASELVFKGIPPLRKDPWTEDEWDSARIAYVREKWFSQDYLLLNRDRQIEENIRMLAGQQWSVFSRLLGRFVDVSHYLTDKERRWRKRPTLNRLLLWFMLTHARMTENPPLLTFQPGTGDRMDAELAEVMDTVWKSLGQDTGLSEVIEDVAAWLIPGGESYWGTVVDPNLGAVIEWEGPAMLSMDGIERVIPNAPYGRDGSPLIAPSSTAADGWEPTGKAFQEYEGGLRLEVYSPLQARGQWGNGIPWHQKRWHALRTALTPEEVWEIFGVKVEPDFRGDDMARVNELRRVMFGSGFFGATENAAESVMTSHDQGGSEGYCDVITLWHAPSRFEGMQQGKDRFAQPGGRLLVVTRTHVLRDGPRPAPFKYTSPIRRLQFAKLPGRPSGTTPQEALNPLQRSYNAGWGQLFDHRTLSTNPITLYDRSQGIDPDKVTNEPGLELFVTRKAGGAPPVEFVKPPPIGEDVYRTQAMLRQEMNDLGQIEGAEGKPPTSNASGELVKELRANSDRFIGPTNRRFVIELARMAEDWLAILPSIWTQEKLVQWAGGDQVLRTVTVLPEMLKANIHVFPDVESMLPEGRGERQQRAYQLWQSGAWGEPMGPEARRHFLDASKFPHLSRMSRPGGVHVVKAEHENGRLAQGERAGSIPIFPWQEHEVHLAVHVEFMASPEYEKLDPAIQQQFVIHWEHHRLALQEVQRMQLQAQTDMEASRIRMSGQAVDAAEEVAGGGGAERMGPPRPQGQNPPRGQQGTPETSVA